MIRWVFASLLVLLVLAAALGGGPYHPPGRMMLAAAVLALGAPPFFLAARGAVGAAGTVSAGGGRAPPPLPAAGELCLLAVAVCILAGVPRAAAPALALERLVLVLMLYAAARVGAAATAAMGARRAAAGLVLALAWSGVAMALTGLLSAAGLLSWEKAYGGWRVHGSFGYANALGAFLALAWLAMLFGDAFRSRRAHFGPAGGARGGARAGGVTASRLFRRGPGWIGRYLVLLGLLLTYSRGTWLALLPALASGFALEQPARRASVLWRIAADLVGAAMAAAGVSRLEGQPAAFGCWMVLGLSCAGLGELLRRRELRGCELRAGSVGAARAALPGTAMLAGPGVRAGAAVLAGFLALLAVPRLRERIGQIRWDAYGVTSRLDTYRDALAMLADHGPLGAGGGAWPALYPSYRSYGYVSNELHSSWLELVVEGGLPVALALALAGVLAWAGLRRRLPGGAAAGLAAAVPGRAAIGAPLALLAVHGWFDFDLSFAVFLLVLGLLLGWTSAAGRAASRPRPRSGRGRGVAIADRIAAHRAARLLGPAEGLMFLAAAVLAGVLALGGLALAAAQGEEAVAAGGPAEPAGSPVGQSAAGEPAGEELPAADLYRLAARLRPLDAAPWLGLARLAEGTPACREAAGRALFLEPRRADSWMELGLCLRSLGAWAEAARPLRHALEIDPFGAERYEALAATLVDWARASLAAGEIERAQALAAEVLALRDRMEAIRQEQEKQGVPGRWLLRWNQPGLRGPWAEAEAILAHGRGGA